jgi:hypothetical protein
VIAKGAVRVPVLGRELKVRAQPELTAVDDRVEPAGGAVAVEPCGDSLVGNDGHRWSGPFGVVGVVALHAEAVIDVTVGEHRGVDGSVSPASEARVRGAGEDRAAAIHQDQARVGVEGADIGERRDEARTVIDFGEVIDVAERVVLGGIELTPPEPVSDLEYVSHGRCPLRRQLDPVGSSPVRR